MRFAGVTVRACVALVLLCGSGAAWAKGHDLPKVGDHPAMAEQVIDFDKRMQVRATLVLDRAGEPATEVTEALQLRFVVAFMAAERARDADLRLHCTISFVHADGSVTAPVRDRVCYEGKLSAASGTWVAIDAPLKFRPGRDDPIGATGVRITIRDEISRKERVLMPTYGWKVGG